MVDIDKMCNELDHENVLEIDVDTGDHLVIQSVIDCHDNVLFSFEDGTENCIVIYDDGRVYRQTYENGVLYGSELLGLLAQWYTFGTYHP